MLTHLVGASGSNHTERSVLPRASYKHARQSTAIALGIRSSVGISLFDTPLSFHYDFIDRRTLFDSKELFVKKTPFNSGGLF